MCAALLITLGISGQDAAIWRVHLRGERDYVLKQSLPGSDGAVWLLVGSRPKGKLGDRKQEFELRRVDASGTLSEPMAIPRMPDSVVDDPLCVALGGSVITVLTTRNGIDVSRFNEKTQSLQGHSSIVAPEPHVFVGAVFPLASGELLIVGRSGTRPWMARINTKLDVVWNQVIDGLPKGFVEGGVANADGSFTLSGVQVVGRSTNLWVASFDKDGKLKTQVALDGMRAHIVSDDNGYVLLHDERDGGWDLWARGFSSELAQRWQRRIATGAKLPPSFALASGPESGWVASFGSERKPVLMVARGDEIAWTHTEPALSETWERIWNVGTPIVIGDSVVFPYTVLTVDAGGEQRQMVTIAKLPGVSQ